MFTEIFSNQLIWPAITLLVFYLTTTLYVKAGKIAIFQPVLLTIVVLVYGLIAFDTPYADYAAHMGIFTLFLTPAIVALAVPLYQNLAQVRDQKWVLLSTVTIGGSIIIVTALAAGSIVGLNQEYLLPLSTKSISAPIAIGIAEKNNVGITVTILAVFTTGLPGAAFTPAVLKILRVRDEQTCGLILGMTSHAFGIARATEISERATAFATLGMGLMGCFAAITVPIIIQFFQT